VPLRALEKAIHDIHGCESTWVESVVVTDGPKGQSDWSGAVEIFDLYGHPKATRCYAWSYTEGDVMKPRRIAVLHQGPIDSPQAAVKSLITGEHEGRPRASAAVLRAGEAEVLMVKIQRVDGTSYWELPGGGLLPSERPEEAVIRELLEETGLSGKVIRKLFALPYVYGLSTTFLVEVDGQDDARLGSDPEEESWQQPKLVDLAWIPMGESRENPEIKRLLETL
jgi:8-oxo-dGTP pyrophosphatase MutT (NUDIX family)